MRELLIRYLLGELDEIEHEEVQRRLAASPELRRQLAQLRKCFSATDDDEAWAEMPRGLASRTTERIAAGCDELVEYPADRAAMLAAAAEPPIGVLGWSLADLTVAGGVVLAVSMLLFPALSDSRNATRRNVCQNNQRQMWLVLANYADKHQGYYPKIGPNENAGSFAVKLVDDEVIDAEELSLLLVCPGAPLADAIRSGQFVMRVPSSARLRAMSPAQLVVARRMMSPFYAYRLPYRVGDHYLDVRDQRLPLSPIFSDTSGAKQNGFMSPNHGGDIVQLTNQDGSVKSLRSNSVPGFNDNLFLNAIGLVAAGVSRHDTVLGHSAATPAFAFPARSR